MHSLTDRYRVLRAVDGLRAARVEVARDRLLGGTVILKTLHVGHALVPELRSEADLLGRLAHPGLVRLVERLDRRRGRSGDVATGLVTQWVDGEALPQWAGRLPFDARLRDLVRLLDVVAYLHRRGFLHLDLKPDNVLGTADGPVVLDLGSARPLDSLTGTAGGTLGYAAPEIIAGEAPTPGSDLYSVGILAYEMLLGRPPFEETEGSALRAAVLRGDWIPPRALDPDLPRPIADLIENLLQTRAADRPDSADEVRKILVDLGAPPVAPGVGRGQLVGRGPEVEDLVERVTDNDDAVLIALVGPTGSGRTRLALEVLAQLPRAEDAWMLDLSAGGDPDAAVSAWLGLLGSPSVASRPAEVVAWLRKRPRGTGCVYLGRMDGWGPELRQRAPELLPAIVAAGISVLFASERLVPWAEPFALTPLHADVLQTVASVLGEPPGGRALALARQSAGLPGALLDRLTLPAISLDTLPDELRRWWPTLATLPDGIPREVEVTLPAELGSAVQTALRAGLLRRTSARLFHRGDVQVPVEVPSQLAAIVPRLVASSMAVDPVWAGLLAARAGHWDLAERSLPTGELANIPVGLDELVDRLADHGSPAARIRKVDLALAVSDHETALRLLDTLPPSDPRVAAARVFALRVARNPSSVSVGRAWREEYGDDPAVIGEEVFSALFFGMPDVVESLIDHVDRALPEARERHLVQAARLSRAAEIAEERGDSTMLDNALEALEAAHPGFHGVHRLVLHMVVRALHWRRDFERASEVALMSLRKADEQGNLSVAASARLQLASLMLDWGNAAEARRAYQQALTLTSAMGGSRTMLRLHASLAELEVRLGRLPATERHLQRFDQLLAEIGEFPEARIRGSILWASYYAARNEPTLVVERLADLQMDGVPVQVKAARALYLLEAYLDLGAYDQARALADDFPATPDLDMRRRVEVARGRVHFALGRFHLERALVDLPQQPDPLERETVGRTLLVAGGEDLDPASFPTRRDQLARATELLQGENRAHAVVLRERLLEGPGAALDQIVGLIEAMGEGPRFLEGLAKVVADALGAHRVLVMLRIPGLGRQVTVREISGQEAAGLAPEVWRRVRRPDDVWLADDAFADPNLRRMSATVRTFQVKSVVAVAIPRDGRVIGALYIDDINRTGRFTSRDVAVLKRLAQAIGQVADLLPARSPSDGLTVHEVHGVYTCSSELAETMRETLARFRASPQGNLLLTGPTGAGKTWLAKRVAKEVLGLSGTIDVVMRPGTPDMLVSQLWGTQRGDFTGAVQKTGAIQRAWREGAALFLDEIQNVDEAGQRILLPLLELPHRRFGSLTGDVRQLDTPLHIILGTNADVAAGSWRGTFREDLWYRMSTQRLDLPPLRDRGREAVYRHLGDLLHLRGLPTPEEVFERAALEYLATRPWRGNLRSLSTLVESADFAYRREARPLTHGEVRSMGNDRSRIVATPETAPPRALDQVQARAVLDALERSRWVQADAAKTLGLSKFALHRLLKKLELIDHVREERSRFRAEVRRRLPEVPSK